MSYSSVESFWVPEFGTSLRLGDIPQKSFVVTGGLRETNTVSYQLPARTSSRTAESRVSAQQEHVFTTLSGLTFDDDVVRERCFDVDTLNSQLNTFLDHTRRRRSSKRHRNDISYLRKPVDTLSYLKLAKPVTSDFVQLEHVAGLHTANGLEPADVSSHGSEEPSYQWRKCPINTEESKEENAALWEECLLKKLSANTARWIVQHHAATEDDRGRLNQILDAAHGNGAALDRVELIAENTDETDASAEKTVKKSWITGKDV